MGEVWWGGGESKRRVYDAHQSASVMMCVYIIYLSNRVNDLAFGGEGLGPYATGVGFN